MSLDPRYLITTADESTWVFDQPVLFLGYWCKSYDRKHVWSKLDYKVAPFHWNDQKKMEKDYYLTQEMYEKILNELIIKLNHYHELNWSKSAWRIVVGPWLVKYIEVIFDRYLSIQYVLENYNIIGASYCNPTYENILSTDADGFSEIIKTDLWNYNIYSILLKHIGAPPLKEKAPQNLSLNNFCNEKIIRKKAIQQKIKDLILYVPKKLFHSSLYSFIALRINQRNSCNSPPVGRY